MIRLLICGDRRWPYYKVVLEILTGLRNDVEVVIEGEAPGADRMGQWAARQLSIPCLEFPANWHKYGRAAGPIRNQEMLDKGKPTHVLAFHTNIEASRGTKDMINRAIKAGLSVRLVYDYRGNYQDLTEWK